MASEDLMLRQKEEKTHFGSAEEVAYQLGGAHRIQRIAAGAPETISTALQQALERHTYDAPTQSLLAEEERHWHTLGSFMMVELLGHSMEAQQLGEAVNVLITFAVEQAFLHQEQEALRLAQEAAARQERYERHRQGLLDGTIRDQFEDLEAGD
mgnify:CR=1 FL=1